MAVQCAKRLDIKMLTHKNNYQSKKIKHDMLKISTREEDEAQVTVVAWIPWTENQDVMELVEAVMNLVAAEHIIRQ